MSGFFSSPKPKMPPVPPPPPLPQVGSEVEDAAMKALRRKSGFRKTLVTGELVPPAKGKTLLGGP